MGKSLYNPERPFVQYTKKKYLGKKLKSLLKV